jgi:hypothetical protein
MRRCTGLLSHQLRAKYDPILSIPSPIRHLSVKQAFGPKSRNVRTVGLPTNRAVRVSAFQRRLLGHLRFTL